MLYSGTDPETYITEYTFVYDFFSRIGCEKGCHASLILRVFHLERSTCHAIRGLGGVVSCPLRTETSLAAPVPLSGA